MARVTLDQGGIAELLEIAGEMRDEMALEIIAAAQPPIDTGFLQASAYLYSAENNLFDQTWPSDYYRSSKTGYLVERERTAEPEQYPENGVTIGWAAIYAWYVEDSQPFIYPALMSVAEGGFAVAGEPSSEPLLTSTSTFDEAEAEPFVPPTGRKGARSFVRGAFNRVRGAIARLFGG